MEMMESKKATLSKIKSRQNQPRYERFVESRNEFKQNSTRTTSTKASSDVLSAFQFINAAHTVQRWWKRRINAHKGPGSLQPLALNGQEHEGPLGDIVKHNMKLMIRDVSVRQLLQKHSQELVDVFDYYVSSRRSTTMTLAQLNQMLVQLNIHRAGSAKTSLLSSVLPYLRHSQRDAPAEHTSSSYDTAQIDVEDFPLLLVWITVQFFGENDVGKGHACNPAQQFVQLLRQMMSTYRVLRFEGKPALPEQTHQSVFSVW